MSSHVDPQPATGAHEVGHRLAVGGRQVLARIVKDGEVVAVGPACPGRAPAAGQIAFQRGEEGPVAVALPGHCAERQGLDGADAPGALELQLHLEHGTAEGLEDLPRQGLEARHLTLPEADDELVGGGHQPARLAPPQQPLGHGVQLLGGQAVELAAGELLDGAHGRDHLVSARLRQQGAVIAHRQVAVAAAQVDHPQVALRSQLPAGQVVARRDHGQPREARTPVGLLLHQQ